MKTLGNIKVRTPADIKKKREDFYNAIKDVKLSEPPENFTLQSYLNILKNITTNCQKLAKAIEERTKTNKEKSKSDDYLIKIKNSAGYIVRYCEEKNNELLNNTIEAFVRACKEAGDAKFGKLTFGAVLDYKPTQEHFKKLSKQAKEVLYYLRYYLKANPAE